MTNRKLPRFRRRLKLSLGGRLPAFTADVSPQGFAAEGHNMRVGTMVRGSISLLGKEFPFTGEVCWAKTGEPRASVRGRFGVRFTGIETTFFELFKSTWWATS